MSGLGPRPLLKHCVSLLLGACCVMALPLAAQDAGSVDIADMRGRDRFAPPAQELAVWQEFSAPVLADAKAPPLLLAETHLGLAIASYYARENASGWEHVATAQALLAELDASPPFHAELLVYGSMLLIGLDRTSEAQEMARQAMELAEAGGEAALADQALAHNALGYLAFARNDYVAAETAFCTARDLGLRAPVPHHAMIVNDASSCGAVKYYLERGDTVAAMRLASDYAFAHLPSDHPKMGNALNNSYAVLVRYGRYGEAVPLIRRHLELERTLRGDADEDVYDPMSMLGRSLELLGRLEEAEGIFRAAVRIAGVMNSLNQPYIPGISRINLAHVLARQGRFEDAEHEARSGLERMVQDLEPDNYHIGSGQIQLADHLSRLGRRDEALALTQTAIPLLEAGVPAGHSEILTARLIRARILSDLGRHDEALALAGPAAKTFAAQLLDIGASETDLVSLSQVLPEALGDYLLVALRAGAMEEAAEAAQLRLLSELALSNAHIKAGAVARGNGLGDLLEQLDNARARSSELEAQLAASLGGNMSSGRNSAEAAADSTSDLAELSANLSTARQDARQAQVRLEAEFPEFVALARPQTASLAQLQSSLQDDELLVFPVSLADRAVTIAIGRDSVQWGEAAIGAPQLRDLAARLRLSAQDVGRFDVDAASQLYQAVFPQSLQAVLASKTQLLFPASGYLARISPAMLLSAPANSDDLGGAPWLVRTHSVKILADMGEVSAAQTGLAGAQFLGVGAPSALPASLSDPARSNRLNLPPLPRGRAELQALAAALGSAQPQILAEADANEDRLRALDLSQYGVIAFATHGLLGGEVPGLSEPALLLTPTGGEGSEGDGLLTASEIAAMTLNADWVILSACETAAGESASAPSYSGLARAFTQAGAHSLMLSHWRVRDDAAAYLSVETMRRAAGGAGRAEALRGAQLAMINDAAQAGAAIPDAAHPAIWAPFIIVEN